MNVNNKAVLRKLTWRSLKGNRFRNGIAIAAIVLTAVMFTGIATMGGALMQTVQESTFRQIGSSAHGGIKYLNEEQYDRILQSDKYKDISYDIILGFATNPELVKKQHELRYAEDKKAQWGFSYPTVGNMPKEYKDIALATTTLDMLGLPHELGQTIHLEFSVNGELHSDDFNLVGIWPGDEVMMAVQVYLSKEYVRDLAPDPKVFDGHNMSGVINADVWFQNSVDIESKLNEMLADCGFRPDEIAIGINWGYAASEAPDATSILLVMSLLLLVMASGYLIIYSIFAISVSGDIRFYGLLKTIGTTGRQIKRIVRGQALLLSAVGIPIGLGLGFFLGTKLAPFMLSITNFDSPVNIKANPMIFLIAAVFSIITVFLSCRKPGKMAAKVSPVEAVRYSDAGTKGKIKEKKARKVTTFSMAVANMGRSKRRLAVVVLSLSLSLVLLNSVVSLVKGFDMDTYLQKQVVADFLISDYSVLTPVSAEDDYEAITPELEGMVSELPGLMNSSRVLFREEYHQATEATMKRFEEVVGPYVEKEQSKSMASNFNLFLSEQSLIFHLYGVDELAFDRMSKNFQKIDWEKFSSGRYALMNTFDPAKGTEDDGIYSIGDKISLKGNNGELIEYELLGYVDIPYPMTCQHGHLVDFNVIIPADNFIRDISAQQPMSLIFDISDEYTTQTENWVEDLCTRKMTNLDYRSKGYYADEFSSMQNTFMLLGGVLSFILAMIGVLNFVNTMATSILTRRRELAMLQSVGMTGRQLKQMLFSEGLWYAILAIGFTLTVGIGISAALIYGIAKDMWFFKFTLSPVPALICAPILLALCAAVPLVCAALLQKESVVERLREE